MDPDEAVRAASERTEEWCAQNPATWPALPDGINAADFTEVWSGTLEHDPVSGETRAWFTTPTEPITVTYERAAYRVWPYAYHYSTQLGTSYHWYWARADRPDAAPACQRRPRRVPAKPARPEPESIHDHPATSQPLDGPGRWNPDNTGRPG